MQGIAVQRLPLWWASSVSPAVQKDCEITLIVLLRGYNKVYSILVSLGRKLFPALAKLKHWCFIALGSGRTEALAGWRGSCSPGGKKNRPSDWNPLSSRMVVHPLKKVDTSTWYTKSPLSSFVTGTVDWSSPYFFPCMAILFRWNCFRILKVLAPRLHSAISSSCSISFPRSKNCVCSASYLYKWKRSANLSLSLGFNRCPQNNVDVLGLVPCRC